MKQEPNKSKRLTTRPLNGTVSRSVLVAISAFLLFVLWLSFPSFIDYMKGPTPRTTCMLRLKNIAFAHMQYTQDFDERMPLVAVHDAAISPQRPLGWADALQPYLKSTEVFQCPSQADTDTSRTPNQNGYTDYWYNARLAGVERTTLRYPASVLLNGEGNDGTDAANARYSLSEQPTAWRNADSPVMRHLQGANYAFADGHVKWMKHARAISTQSPDEKNATFAVR